MKFSGKMRLMIILKVTKNQDLTLSIQDAFLKKRKEGVKLTFKTGGWRVNLSILHISRRINLILI